MVKIGTYSQAIAFLESLWPKKQPSSFSLRGIKAACAEIGNPQDRYKTIHVAGTSGKGSVVGLTALALTQAGYKTGAYYSPYLESPREVIQINGQMISELEFAEEIAYLKPIIKKYRLTFYEAKTLLAFDYFARKQVDIAVIEVGLGGRLDATNVITPIVSVITSVDLDHTEMLGKTLTSIAREKAGIIKSRVPIVTGAVQSGVQKIISQIAKEKQAPLTLVKTKGTFDERNLHIAKAIFNILNIPFNPTSGVGLAGRFEVVEDIIMDGAHNPAKMQAFVEKFQKEYPRNKAVVLFGALKDKDYKRMVARLKPITRKLVTTKGLSNFHKFMTAQFNDPIKALNYAKSLLKPGEKLIITGSLYLVGELRHVVLQRPKIS